MNYKCNSRPVEGKSSVMLTNAWSQRENTAGSLPAHRVWSWNQCLSQHHMVSRHVCACGLHMQCYVIYSNRRMQIVFLIDLLVALCDSVLQYSMPWCMQMVPKKTVSKLWHSWLTIYRLFDRESNWRQLDVMNALLSQFPSDLGDILWLWFKCVMQPNNKKHDHVCLNGAKHSGLYFYNSLGGKKYYFSSVPTQYSRCDIKM